MIMGKCALTVLRKEDAMMEEEKAAMNQTSCLPLLMDLRKFQASWNKMKTRGLRGASPKSRQSQDL